MEKLYELEAKSLCGLSKAKACFRKLFKEEKGASDLVTILVIIVIVIALGVLFKDRLAKLINSIFDKASTDINDLSTPVTGN